MKQSIISILRGTTRSLGNLHNYQIPLMFSFIILFLSLLFLSFGKGKQSKTNFSENIAILPVVTPPTILPTQWWIKTTATSTPRQSDKITPRAATEPATDKCTSSLSSTLQPQTYAYISLTPSLPNRVRAGAGKVNAYLGQIQPGKGVRIIDGPVCADSTFWWLVESTESQLRGWTVMGNGSQQWIMPCPNPKIPCEKLPVTPRITPTEIFTLAEENINSGCNSSTFAVGMFVQVAEDNLLVIRSEPYTGSVIGHAGPMSTIKILDGPACAGNAIWWKVNLATDDLTGWATEANLRVCTKENDCF